MQFQKQKNNGKNMKNYKIYFEIYGKKMKTTVKANSENEAVKLVKDKILIKKIVPEDGAVDFLKNIFGT